ncbi:beta-carotene 15,15'-dioxygenase, Brp/Blh family [Asaia siamensis]
MTGRHDPFLRLYWGCAVILAAASILTSSTLLALAAIILFGLPHGALDGEMARQILRPRYGAAWFILFALPYLALLALVLALWRLYPLATLTGFLALSLWHFGNETRENGTSILSALVWGGAPLILPSVFHPAATASLLSAMAPPVHLTSPPFWLVWLFPFWVMAASAWLGVTPREKRLEKLGLLCGLTTVFVVLPPLQAFMIYFIFQHAPAHVATLVEDRRWERLVSARAALRYSLSLTVATLIIGALLIPFYTGPIVERLLSLTFQLLAALTLPHMVFDFLTGQIKEETQRCSATRPV